jgi:hypothetical protein
VYDELLKRLREDGLVESENFSEFTRAAIEELSKKVGLTPIKMSRLPLGRKPGKSRV